MKKFLKKYSLQVFLATLLIGLVATSITIELVRRHQASNTGVSAEYQAPLGTAFPDAKWFIFPQGNFSGFETKRDASKIADGSNANGQNTMINDGDRISIRNFGNTILGTATTTEEAITSLHTFRRRNGENILMRSRGTYIEYFEEGNDTWESVTSTLTSGQQVGYTDFNINTDQRSYVYYGNAQEPTERWTGAHTLVNGALSGGEGTITVDDTSDFTATGTIRLCDTNVVYTAKAATTFTVASAPACADNRGVVQASQAVAGAPKGNIFLNANNRIFIAGITSTPQAVYFSKYGDPTTWLTTLVSDATADAAGIFNLAEGGGGVTGMVMDEGAIYIFKKSIIYKATLTDALYNLQPLKPFDGKSQTTGSVYPKTTFAGGNGIYFVTPDKQIMSLSRIENVDYPQLIPISNVIKPTTDDAVYSSGAGISFQDKAYFAVKTNAESTYNDAIFLFNERLKVWESPIVGWAASDFTIYDDGTGEALYFGSSQNANVYKVTSGALDNGLGVTANYRTRQYDFGAPAEQKELDSVWVEGYISDNTTLSISLLLDENGFTQTYTASVAGTETAFLYTLNPFNLFGFNQFGYERFGTSNQVEQKKFRIYFNKNVRQTPFYTAQLEFASDGSSAAGQNWEVLNYGFHVRGSSQPEKRTLYREFR